MTSAPDLRPVSFVGRSRELAELTAALEEAADGRGSAYLVTGEAGIGKSTLVDELSRRSASVGAVVAWGRCWEAGGAPAYWPWIQVLRALVRQPSGLDAFPRERSNVIAQIVPEFADAAVDPRPTLSPDEARFALYDAVTLFLRDRAAERPLLVILEDLHTADVSSLHLLRFIAREIRPLRALIVGTYREADMRAHHNLESLFGDVEREATTVPLRGLTREDVDAYIRRVAGDVPDPSVSSVVHRRTEGNPLFMEGLVRLLAAEGRLRAPLVEPLVMPDGIRDAIERRLARVSDDERRLLQTASVLGRHFETDALSAMTGSDRETIESGLSDSARAGLIAQTLRGRFSFSHVLIRDALYEAMDPAARSRAHLAAADAIERAHAADIDSSLAVLAAHCFEAQPDGLPRAIDYAQRAGAHSLETLAYEDAAAWFERALDGLRLVHGDDRRRAELTLSLADAIRRSGDLPRARATVRVGIEAARATGDPALQARAVLMIGELELGGLWVRPWRPDPEWISYLEDGLAVIGDDAGVARASLLAQLGAALYFTDQQERSAQLTAEALDTAERLADDTTLGFCLMARHVASWSPDNLDERTAIATRVIALAERISNRELLMQALIWNVTNHLERGDVAGARAHADRYTAIAEQLRRPQYLVYSTLTQAMFASMQGRFADAESMLLEARAMAEHVGDESARSSALVPYAIVLREQGRLGELRDEVRRWAQAYGNGSQWIAFATWVEVLAGHAASGLEMKRQLMQTRAWTRNDSFTLSTAVLATEISFYTGDTEGVDHLTRVLEPLASRYGIGGRNAIAPNGPVARFAGMAASMAGRLDDAERFFAAALEQAALVGDLRATARIHFEMARTIAVRDPARARGSFESARALASEFGMTALVAEIDAVPVTRKRNAASATRDGDRWIIAIADERVAVEDRVGVRYLARLLANPHREIHVLELASGGDSAVDGRSARAAAGGTDVLDDRAKREYRARVREIEEELEEGRSVGDEKRVSLAEQELDAIVGALRAATGLGGRTRKIGSDTERARVSVTKALRTAIDRVGERAPTIGLHLEATIRTGSYCSYGPERDPTSW